MKSTENSEPRPENQDQKAKNSESRTENQGQRVMARESRAVSQGLSVKAREPKLKSSGLNPDARPFQPQKVEAAESKPESMPPTKTGPAIQIQPPEKGDEARNIPKTRAEIGAHLLQALLPMKSTKANGPRPENQDQKA